MRVIFYNTQDKKNTVDKTLTQITTKDILFLDMQNILKPYIRVSDITNNANYVYIPNLHRYYFIDNLYVDNNDSYIYNLSIDVLYTYKDKIKNTFAKIIVNENMISDSIDYTPSKAKTRIMYNLNNPFDNQSDILVTSIHGA